MEVINPTNEQDWLEARTKDITSTEIAALFGISPYITEFELWHRKKSGVVVKFEENERMEWGTALQDAIAAKIGQKNGWKVRRMTEYIRDPELRAGASFDFDVETLEIPQADNNRAYVYMNHLLEIKNVDSLQFKNGWEEDDNGNIEAPLHIEIQVQQQLMVSGRSVCHIGALIGGNKLVMIERTANNGVFKAIRDKIAAFWASIESNTPPQPNFERDAAFISKLYGFADPGKVANISGNTDLTDKAKEYRRLSEIAKDAETKRKAIKAEILTQIGDAEKAIGDGFKISASMISGGPVSYVREGYRDFRMFWAKEKA